VVNGKHIIIIIIVIAILSVTFQVNLGQVPFGYHPPPHITPQPFYGPFSEPPG